MKDYTKDIGFWKRLQSFVSDVQTNCCMGEEEKQMIIHNCKLKILDIQRVSNSVCDCCVPRIVETKYRIVSDYGHGDKSWIDRDLTKEEVKDYFVKYRNWTEQDFDEVGIEHFMDTDFTHYVEIDNIDDVEGVD